MKGPGRTIRRRRREARTDYKKRFGLLKSGKIRIVVRKTNKRIIAQAVSSVHAQDKVEFSVSSQDLMEYGWPKEMTGSLKNRTAAYLTGYLVGVKAKNLGELILDMGMQRSVKKSRIYAFLKGMVDSGAKISHGEESLPSEEEIGKGKTGNLIDKIRKEIK